jgi:phytoene desaturase
MGPNRVVVIGAGQGGLSAAIHARLMGHEVLVLERGRSPGGKAGSLSIGDYLIDPGPSIIILTDVYEEVFRRAGKRMADYLSFERLDPFTRVILEGHAPLDLPMGQEECIKALSSQAPEDEASLRLLLDKLDRVAPGIQDAIFTKPIHQLWQLANPKLMRVGFEFDVSKTYKELVDGLFKSDLLRAFFYGFPSYSGATYRSKAAGAFMIPYFMIRSGVWKVSGGVGTIPKAFAQLARDLGVEFEYGWDVEEVELEGGQVRSVRSRTGEVRKGSHFVSNMDRISFGALLGRPEPSRPSFSYYTLHWGISREMPALEHHTLLIPRGASRGFEELYDERRPSTRPIVYLNSTPAPSGKTCLFAVATVPAKESHLDWTAEAARLKSAIRSELELFGLGFRDDEVEFEREQTPLYFEEAHRNWKGTLYGPDEEERLWKLLPLRCRDEQIRNLYYAGGAVQPGAGLPMVTLSGRFAAGLLPRARQS